jgi:hypothetical protein
VPHQLPEMQIAIKAEKILKKQLLAKGSRSRITVMLYLLV